MADLPTGTVTFLFTDIEGSTTHWEHQRTAMQAALARHDAILRETIEAHSGHVVKTVGDAFYAVFAIAPEAVEAALQAQALLQREPWDEAIGAVRVRMALHTGGAEERDGDYFGQPLNRVARLLSAGHGGQILLSLATHELVRDQLPPGIELRDLGEHRLKDLLRSEHVFQVVVPETPADFPPLKTLEHHPNNLPLQPTPFIGRERELEVVWQRLLRPDVRLLTLTGPGGTGKTRLALQAVADLLDQFRDGVFFVNLAPISGSELVASTITATLGIQEVVGQSLRETLKRVLHSQQLLLVLDNFEQLLPAAPLVSDLLAAAPKLKVLVTSRALLGVYGEQHILVPPLALPDPNHLPPLEHLSQYEAVRLFIERAEATRADFNVTNENAPAVAEICARLDGLPLAIELAAARIRVLPPQALLQRLGHALSILTGGARDLHVRQQTLRNTIDWSYNLLDAEDQQLFTRLGVFVGGCTIEAAESVASERGDMFQSVSPPTPVLDGLESLVDKSLLRQEEGVDGEAHFHMLETIHQYALERLQASGELEAVRRRHAEYFLELVEGAEPAIRRAAQVALTQRLKADYDNLRAALAWSQTDGDAEIGMRIGAALWIFWKVRGYVSEGRTWLTAMLARPGAAGPTTVRAKALNAAGDLSGDLHDLVTARALLEESRAISNALGDKSNLAYALKGLGRVASLQGDTQQAVALCQESLALFRELGDQMGIPWALGRLGYEALYQGDIETARVYYKESLAIFRGNGSQGWMAAILNSLGEVARYQGDYQQAAAYYDQSLALNQELGYKEAVAMVLHNLGYVAQRQGDAIHAAELFRKSLVLNRDLGLNPLIAESIIGLAGVAVVQGSPVAAARLFGAAETVREGFVSQMHPADQAEYDRDMAAARAQLDGAAWETAWAEGRAMTLEQAIAFALQEDT